MPRDLVRERAEAYAHIANRSIRDDRYAANNTVILTVLLIQSISLSISIDLYFYRSTIFL